MCGRSSDSTSLPEPSGPFDDRFVYGLTDDGRKVLAEQGRANGRVAFTEGRCTPALASEERLERKRRRRRNARARGVRLGSVCGRWRDGRRLPDLRMTDRWLQKAGFDLGHEYEVEVEAGKLTIQAL